MYKICVYIPKESVESVKQAMFNAGAGVMGQYDCCAWQTEGAGQFRPLAGSNPAVGQLGNTEHVLEYQLETVCHDDVLPKVLKQMLAAHPYEEPAYQYWRVNAR